MASDTARLDTWLWAARFFKTRAQAAAAIDGGKVDVNGARAKRAKRVAPGDELRIRKSPFEYRVTVRGLAEQRGPPRLAAALYDEAPEGKRRVLLAEQPAVPPPRRGVRWRRKPRPVAPRAGERQLAVARQPSPHDVLPVRRVQHDLPDVVASPPAARPPQRRAVRHSANRPRERCAVPSAAIERLV